MEEIGGPSLLSHTPFERAFRVSYMGRGSAIERACFVKSLSRPPCLERLRGL